MDFLLQFAGDHPLIRYTLFVVPVNFFLRSPLFSIIVFITAQVTYNSQKREARVFEQPGGGGLVDETVLLSGAALQQRLNEIYNMSDDEDESIVDVAADESGLMAGGRYRQTTDYLNLNMNVARDPASGVALYGNVRQVKMQLGL